MRLIYFQVVVLLCCWPSRVVSAFFGERQKSVSHALKASTSTAFISSSTTTTTTKPSAKPERGKFVKSPIDPEDLFQAYREIKEDYRNKTSSPNIQWKVLNDMAGVEVALLQHPSDPTCPYVRMKAVIPVSVEHCWDFLRIDNWDQSMPKMDPFYESVSIHEDCHYNQTQMILCQKRMKRILAFGKRDLVFLSVAEDAKLDDGTWVSGSVSVNTDQIPRQPGYTRAFQDSIAFYKPLDNGTKTGLTIVCRIDLNDSSEDGEGGAIPMWLYVKTIGLTGAQSVVRMRNALVKEQEEREKQADI